MISLFIRLLLSGVFIVLIVFSSASASSESGHFGVLNRFERAGLLEGADNTILRLRQPTGYEIAELLQVLMNNMAEASPALLIEKVPYRDLLELRHLIGFYSAELAFNMMVHEDELEKYRNRLEEYAFILAEGGQDTRVGLLPKLESPVQRKPPERPERFYTSDRLIELPSYSTLRKNGLVAQSQYMLLRTYINNVEANGTRMTFGLRYGITGNLELGIRDHRYSLSLANQDVRDYIREAELRYVLEIARRRKVSFVFNSFTSSEDYIETYHRYQASLHMPIASHISQNNHIVLTAVAEDYKAEDKDGIRLWAGVNMRIIEGREPVYLMAETLSKGNYNYNLFNIGLRVPANPSMDLIYSGDTRTSVYSFGARLWYEF